MTLADITTEDLSHAITRALQTVEGGSYDEWARPWVWTLKPMASPPVVVYQASSGKTYERSYSIEIEGENINAVLGEERREVEPRTVWVPVPGEVAGAFNFSGDYKTPTTWKGLIFRAGEYQERNLKFTGEDLRTMVANFPAEGVPIKTEHVDTIWDEAFNNHGGRLARIWTEAGDTELHGEFKTPGWADFALEGIKKAVSVGLSATFDAIREISLVLNPRVLDACVYSRAAVAFSASPDFQTFAAKHPSEAASIVTEAAKAPAPATENMDKPNVLQRLTALFAGKTPEQRAALTEHQIAEAVFTDEPTPAPTTPTFAVDPAIRAEIEQLKANQTAQQAQFAMQQDANDALAFFRDELKAGRATPAEESDVIAQFSTARKADRLQSEKAQAAFSAGAEGTDEKALRDRFSKRETQFNYGGGRIPSNVELDLSTVSNPTGVFTAADFGKTEETK